MLPRIMDAHKQETKQELYGDWGLRPILYGNHIKFIHIKSVSQPSYAMDVHMDASLPRYYLSH